MDQVPDPRPWTDDEPEVDEQEVGEQEVGEPEVDEQEVGAEDPADGALRPLDPAYREAERTASRIFCGILLAVGLGAWCVAVVGGWLGPTARWIVLAAGTSLVIAGYRVALLHTSLELRRTRYRLTPQALEIRKGVWWRRVIHVPCSRVQHIDVSQGPLQRRHSIATLTVHTAGTEGASVELSGLRHALALRTRDELLRRSADLGERGPAEEPRTGMLESRLGDEH